ncbi:MAG: adenylate/guanylate cyclase domain-containing protein [Thermodesulfovibrionales bacterium]|nr:adenylate/guanylate cyclase domain-containing protein [Thermodesulfovibrionales bacterium]
MASMNPEDDSSSKKDPTVSSADLEKLLEQRAQLDELIQKKFTKVITIMFTDLKGSTSIAESEGDIVSRFLIKRHHDILIPIIKQNGGVLVKTMGDGTLSYFQEAVDGIRASVDIQTSVNDYNSTRKSGPPILLRIGLNTGTGMVERSDIYGDVVNTASRFESLAGPGEIYISENTYDALGESRNTFYCRFIKESTLKEKKGSFKIFKVFWDNDEIERDKFILNAPLGAETGPRTITFNAYSRAHPVVEDEMTQEDNALVRKANHYEKEQEFLKLFLLCEDNRKNPGLEEMYQNLKNNLERYDKMDIKFFDEDAIWFFKRTIIMGRVSLADFPISNQALSRIPIRVGIKNGEGFLEVENKGAEKINTIEIEKPAETVPVRPGVEFSLGTTGKIIFSVCFPIEFRVYKDRFLSLKILNPEECIRKHFHVNLNDIWKEFNEESNRILIIGK